MHTMLKEYSYTNKPNAVPCSFAMDRSKKLRNAKGTAKRAPFAIQRAAPDTGAIKYVEETQYAKADPNIGKPIHAL